MDHKFKAVLLYIAEASLGYSEILAQTNKQQQKPSFPRGGNAGSEWRREAPHPNSSRAQKDFSLELEQKD